MTYNIPILFLTAKTEPEDEEKGKHFDPVLVDHFLSISDEIKSIMQSYQEK